MTVGGLLLVRVHELEDKIARSVLAPDEVVRDQQKALAEAEEARQRLRLHYASGKSDAKAEKAEVKLREAVEAAERVAEERWDERLAGARMSEGVARDELQAFIRENFAALAAELLPACVEAAGRFDVARAAYAESLEAKRELLDEWRVLIRSAGIPQDDLPDERSVELPAPRSLAAAADALTVPPAATEAVS